MSNLIPIDIASDVKNANPEVAILPIGSFEQHGPYLPLSTDTLIACTISETIAHNFTVLRLSPVTISCSHEHSAWPGTTSISARTLHQMINDIFYSLQRSSIKRLVLINAHGGNYVLRNIVQEASVSGNHMALFPESAHWAAARSAANIVTTDHQDMHAGELETSILLYAYPEVVREGYENADHIADDRTGFVTLGMEAFTKTGIIGRPSLASPTKGKAVLESLGTSFGKHLRNIGAPGAKPK
jgi:creatinine amidohydrolase